MKVVQINCTYDYGSTGKITKDLHNALKENGIESVVLYGRRQKSTQKDVIKTCSELEAKGYNLISRVTGRPYAVAPSGTRKLIAQLEQQKPDIVHLQCINGFFVDIYQLLNYLKKKNISTVLTLHAEFMYTGNCGHAFDCDQWKTGCKKCPDKKKALNSFACAPVFLNWCKMKEAFEGFDSMMLCPVSEWLKMRAQQAEILNQYPMCTVFNGIDTTIFSYNREVADEMRNKLQLNGKKVILHVTANYKNPMKGGKYITKLSQKVDDSKYCVIVVDGNDNPPPEEFCGLYWGRAKNQQELSALYMLADVMTITSSRECLPTTCVESLCCGTPIVCFDFHDGFGEPGFPQEYVKMVPFGDINKLTETILYTLQDVCCKEFISSEMKKIFGKKTMMNNYMQIYRDIQKIKNT